MSGWARRLSVESKTAADKYRSSALVRRSFCPIEIEAREMMSTVLNFRDRSSSPTSAISNAPRFDFAGAPSRSRPPCRVVSLAAKAIAHPREAPTFGEAVLPHLDAAFRLACCLARDQGVAEDIVQDACVRALQSFATFRGKDARARLLQIVRNIAHSELRTRRVGVEASLDHPEKSADDAAHRIDVADPDPGPEAALAAKQDLARLAAAMAALPTDLRECLALREIEGLSYEEIAQITGAPIGRIVLRLRRARQSLIASASDLGN
jgi:RNA polymerase sigma factor (sigma-70 family)